MKKNIISNCKKLISAYENGDLGQTVMPEDTHPKFSSKEERLSYFTLPMSLNYQRNSYSLWESAKKTFEDEKTKSVFDLENYKDNKIREKLLKYKLALQPNKHTNTWITISKTINENFGSFERLFENAEYDFLKLKSIMCNDYKKDFPYISGPKIFNYWSKIIQDYGQINLSNSEFIEIAPDTHIIKGSILLGVITKEDAEKLSKEKINEIWRNTLSKSGITPIEMHAPLWFWSKNNFNYKLE